MTFHQIPPEIQLIRRETREFSDRMRKAGRFGEVMPTGWDADLLQTKTADQWLKDESGKPAARMLFGNFWHENELCILFADTNMGKSVLAVQIGRHLACLLLQLRGHLIRRRATGAPLRRIKLNHGKAIVAGEAGSRMFVNNKGAG